MSSTSQTNLTAGQLAKARKAIEVLSSLTCARSETGQGLAIALNHLLMDAQVRFSAIKCVGG